MAGRMPELISSAGAETGEVSGPGNISSAGSLMGVSSAGAGPEVIMLVGAWPEGGASTGRSGAGPEISFAVGLESWLTGKFWSGDISLVWKIDILNSCFSFSILLLNSCCFIFILVRPLYSSFICCIVSAVDF